MPGSSTARIRPVLGEVTVTSASKVRASGPGRKRIAPEPDWVSPPPLLPE